MTHRKFRLFCEEKGQHLLNSVLDILPKEFLNKKLFIYSIYFLYISYQKCKSLCET